MFTKLTFKNIQPNSSPLNISLNKSLADYFLETSLGALYMQSGGTSVITSRPDYTVYHQIIYFRIIKANDIVKALMLVYDIGLFSVKFP